MSAGGCDARGSGSVCPECGGPARAVGLKTVKHLLAFPLSHTATGEGWLYCADPECDVYYFRVGGANAFGAATGPAAAGVGGAGGAGGADGAAAAATSPAGAQAGTADSGLAAPAAPESVIFGAADIKDRARPYARGADRLVCYCFGHTAGDIAADARSGRHEIPAAVAAEVRAGMCACEVLNPGGG